MGEEEPNGSDAAPDSTTEPVRVPIMPVLLVNFIGSLGLSIVIPFLVFLVRGWQGNAALYGFLAATYPAFQLIGGPLLGRWSDAIGRRRVLLVSQFGTLLSWLVFAGAFFVPERVLLATGSVTLTLPVLVLFFARAVDGLTGGNISVANAYLGDISTDANRSRNFGWMAIASNAGFVVGPALAGMLGATPLGNLLPVLTAAAVSLVGTLVIAFVLPESKRCLNPEPNTEPETLRRTLGSEPADCDDADSSQVRWGPVLRQPHVPLMLTLYLLIYLAFNIFYSAFPNHAATGLGWDVRQTGFFFTLLSIVMVVVQGPVLGWASKRVPAPRLVVIGGAIMAGCFSLLAVRSSAAAYSAALLFALGNGLMWPSYMGLLSKTGNPSWQGTLQGIASASGGVASILGLIVGGQLFATLGELTFYLAAGVILFAALLAVWRLGEIDATPSLKRNGETQV